jgi:hypothetical protein
MSEGTNPRLIGALLPDPAHTQRCAGLKPSLHTQCRASVYARVGQFVAQLRQALLNEVGQRQQHGHTEHNHNHRRHAAPQA